MGAGPILSKSKINGASVVPQILSCRQVDTLPNICVPAFYVRFDDTGKEGCYMSLNSGIYSSSNDQQL